MEANVTFLLAHLFETEMLASTLAIIGGFGLITLFKRLAESWAHLADFALSEGKPGYAHPGIGRRALSAC